MGDDGADKREIDQRRDESGKPADDPAVRVDFNISALVAVLRQPQELRLWEEALVFGMDTDMNTVEFFDDAAQAEGSQIFPQASSPLPRKVDTYIYVPDSASESRMVKVLGATR